MYAKFAKNMIIFMAVMGDGEKALGQWSALAARIGRLDKSALAFELEN